MRFDRLIIEVSPCDQTWSSRQETLNWTCATNQVELLRQLKNYAKKLIAGAMARMISAFVNFIVQMARFGSHVLRYGNSKNGFQIADFFRLSEKEKK